MTFPPPILPVQVEKRVKVLKAAKEKLYSQANKEFQIQRLEQRIYKLRAAVARIKVSPHRTGNGWRGWGSHFTRAG